MVQRGYVDPENLKMRLERMAQSLDCNTGQLRHLILLELWLRGSRFASIRGRSAAAHEVQDLPGRSADRDIPARIAGNAL